MTRDAVTASPPAGAPSPADIGHRIGRRPATLLDQAAGMASSPQGATMTDPAKAASTPAPRRTGADPDYLVDLTALGLSLPEIISTLGLQLHDRTNLKRTRSRTIGSVSPRNLAGAVIAAAGRDFMARVSSDTAEVPAKAVAQLTAALEILSRAPLSVRDIAILCEFARNFPTYAGSLHGRNVELDAIMNRLGLNHPFAAVTAAVIVGSITAAVVTDPGNTYPKLVFTGTGEPREKQGGSPGRGHHTNRPARVRAKRSDG